MSNIWFVNHLPVLPNSLMLRGRSEILSDTGFLFDYDNEQNFLGMKKVDSRKKTDKVNFILSDDGLTITREPFISGTVTHTSGVHLNFKEITSFFP